MFGKDVVDHFRPRRYSRARSGHLHRVGICCPCNCNPDRRRKADRYFDACSTNFYCIAAAIFACRARTRPITFAHVTSHPICSVYACDAIRAFEPIRDIRWMACRQQIKPGVSLDVPLSIARPDPRVIVGKRDRSVDQTGDLNRQPKTNPKSIKSEIDARKAAAAWSKTMPMPTLPLRRACLD
jgi:hypothetical protein